MPARPRALGAGPRADSSGQTSTPSGSEGNPSASAGNPSGLPVIHRAVSGVTERKVHLTRSLPPLGSSGAGRVRALGCAAALANRIVGNERNMTQAAAHHSPGGAVNAPRMAQRPSGAAGAGPSPAGPSEDHPLAAGFAECELEPGRNARGLD